MAFFFYNSELGRVVAGYPSPGGVTECELDLAAWDRLADAHPLLGVLAPDVEAILVNRNDGRNEAFLMPVDECYPLVGELRMKWQGFDGGAEARAALTAFLEPAPTRVPLERRDPVPGQRQLQRQPELKYRDGRPGLRLHRRGRGTIRRRHPDVRADHRAVRGKDSCHALRGQIRIEPHAAGTPRTRRSGCTTYSATRRGGSDSRADPARHRHHHGALVHRGD
jgi:hypothetical protein